MMDDWLTKLLAGLVALGGAFAAWLSWPKISADAGKARAETADINYGRIVREIARLETIIRTQGEAIEALEARVRALAAREIDLEMDNRRKTLRIEELESMMDRAGGGVGISLRKACPPVFDAEGEALREMVEKGLGDV